MLNTFTIKNISESHASKLVHSLFISMVVFWVGFSMLIIFLISDLCYAYNMLKIMEPVVTVMT